MLNKKDKGGMFSNLIIGKKSGGGPSSPKSSQLGKRMEEPPTILVPPRRGALTVQSITPGRSLTSSVLGRGPTGNVYALYKFGKRLGGGQFGTAYLCRDSKTGQSYACKTISRSSLISEEDVQDMRTEVNIMYHLQGQPNIVQIKGTYEDRQSIHIVMELCEGGELFDEINARVARNNVPYSERDAAQLAKSLIRSVERCHTLGVIHRDLKPENFLLTSKNPDSVLKMADFGLAAYFKPGQTFNRVCGSAMYMAPEIIRLFSRRRSPSYGPEVDIWSAGIILYILLSGSHPFPAPLNERTDAGFMKMILRGNPSFVGRDWQGVSQAAKDLIRTMLSVDPRGRPTAQEVLNHPWIQNAPEEPLQPMVVERFHKFLELVRLKKFKKLAVRAIARSLEEEKVAEVLRILQGEDIAQEGVLPVEKLLMAVRKAGAEETVQDLTSSILETGVHPGSQMDYMEFMAAAQQLTEIEKQENLFKAFSLFDQDLSGYISAEELQHACHQFKLTPRMVEDLSQEVNHDETGRLDYNEFVALIRKEAGGVSRRSVESSLDDGSFREKEMSEFTEALSSVSDVVSDVDMPYTQSTGSE